MTTLISWKGVDTHGISSIYIASDSRVTFSANVHSDNCRKILVSTKHPLIFGYCGDVVYPLFHIGAILSLIDSFGISCIGNNFDDHCFSICSMLNSSSEEYFKSIKTESTIIFVEREFIGMDSIFRMCKFKFINGKYINEKIDIESSSPLIFAGGSGGIMYTDLYYDKFRANSVSREVFWALCSFIKSGVDKNTGGSPQLAGLFKKGSAVPHCVVWNDSLYFCGTDINSIQHHSFFEGIKCVNENFELCNPITKNLKEGAQRQPIIKKK